MLSQVQQALTLTAERGADPCSSELAAFTRTLHLPVVQTWYLFAPVGAGWRLVALSSRCWGGDPAGDAHREMLQVSENTEADSGGDRRGWPLSQAYTCSELAVLLTCPSLGDFVSEGYH